MEDLRKQLDACNISEDKAIKNELVKGGEQFVMSATIFKFNDYKKRQERNIMVSDKCFYNLKGKTVKRKIDLATIKGITVGKFGYEFILHIKDEYDYRYESEKRDKILYHIISAVCKKTGKKLPFYMKNDMCLFNYSTTKADQKKGLDRSPTEGEIMVDGDDYKKQIDGENIETDQLRSKTTTLYTNNKREVTLEDFKLLKVLGKGGFGIVFMVEDKQTKEQYAMKVLKKEFIMKHGQVENTKVEKMILEHVNHPYLVSLIYAFQDPKHLYFVTQLMKCGELYEHMVQSRKFAENRARFYTIQLALGLGHLHSKGYVYRDLKLENILVDEKGNVHLADFGLSKLIKNNELAMSICGTPEYMSPEVIQGQGCDKTTDWWALGTLVYEMLFGLPPFYSKIKNTMLDRIKKEELRFPSKPVVSDEAKDFIAKCLNKDRTKRLGCYKDMEDILTHPWFNGVDMQAMLEKKVPPPFVPDPSRNYLDDQVQNMEARISDSNKKMVQNDDGSDPFENF